MIINMIKVYILVSIYTHKNVVVYWVYTHDAYDGLCTHIIILGSGKVMTIVQNASTIKNYVSSLFSQSR